MLYFVDFFSQLHVPVIDQSICQTDVWQMYKNLHSHLGDMGVQLTTRQMYLKFLSFIAIKYYLGGEIQIHIFDKLFP